MFDGQQIIWHILNTYLNTGFYDDGIEGWVSFDGAKILFEGDNGTNVSAELTIRNIKEI